MPVLSDRFAAGWSEVMVAAVYGLVFLALSYLPLSTSHVWRHVAAGEEIIATRQLPTHDPSFVLAEGMSYTNDAWLSQATFALMTRWGGNELLNTLRTLIDFATLLALGFVVYRITKSSLLSVVSVVALFFATWNQLALFGPISLAICCASMLLLLCPPTKMRRASRAVAMRPMSFVAVTLLMLIWANLDRSVVIGVMYLSVLAAGRMFDVVHRLGLRAGIARFRRDRVSRQACWLAELALLASLVQPQGFGLWVSFFGGFESAWWLGVGGYRPLHMTSWYGLAWLVSGVFVLWLMRQSKRRISAIEVMLIGGAFMLSMANEPLTAFVLPCVVVTMMPRIAELTAATRSATADRIDRFNATKNQAETPRFKFALTLVCLLITWCAFALSPVSRPLLGGSDREPAHLYGQKAPLAATQFLSENKTDGMIFAPSEWGDWLAWSLGDEASVFIGAERHRFPQQVKHDYGVVVRGLGGWDKALDRYGVETLVARKGEHDELIDSASKAASGWRIVHEDKTTVVFRRKSSSRALPHSTQRANGGGA